MATIEDLGRKVKAKYPGQYDDLPDMEVGRRVKAKFPGAYDDFTDAPAEKVSALAEGARKVGETAADAATSFSDLASGALDPVMSAAGAAGSYLVPTPENQGSFLDRFKNEMEGRRRARAEAHERSPIASTVASVAPVALAPELAAKIPAPFSAAAPTEAGALPFLARGAAGVADAALLSGATAAGTNLDRPGVALEKTGEALSSPANLVGAVPAVGLEAAKVADPAKQAVAWLARKTLPQITPTPASARLLREGVPLTSGQLDPGSTLGTLEEATALVPKGMGPEREAARVAYRNMVLGKAAAPGEAPPTSGGLHERFAQLEEGFDRAYAPLKARPVARDAVAKLPDSVLDVENMPGIPPSVRTAAAGELRDALGTLPEPPKAGTAAGDPIQAPSRTRAVAMPEDSGAKAAKIPEWLSPEDFHANREAWDWTWSATGGPEAPRAVQELVFEHMRKAVPGPEDFNFGENAQPIDTFELKKGYAAAKLAQGAGGAKWQALRDYIAEWAAQPASSRPADPIGAFYSGTGRDPWGQLVNATGVEKAYGRGTNRYGDVPKTNALRTWLIDTQAALNPDHPAYTRPPPWYGDFPPDAPGAGAPAAASPAGPEYTVGDLIGVRKYIREEIRSARRSEEPSAQAKAKALEAAEDAVTATIEGALSPDEVGSLRATDRQYARFMARQAAVPLGREDFTPYQLAKQVERGSGRRAWNRGAAGEDQELTEAGDRVFGTRVPKTGITNVVLKHLPNFVTVPALNLASSPAVQASLLRQPYQPPPRPMTPADLGSGPARSAFLAWLLQRGGAPGRFVPTPAAAEDDR